jgi:HK97 family phage portal protein
VARKFNLFNFLEKKVDTAEISPVTQKILEQLAFKELALHIAISYIANTLSKCEFKTFENGVEVKNKLYYMLNISPNPNQNSSQFINKFIEKYYYDGHSLLVPNGENLYCADSFDIDDSNPLKENTFFNVTFNCQTLKKKHRASEVFYIQLDNKNVKAIVDSLYMHYGEIISIALAAYKRTNGTKYKLLLEQYRAGDAVFEKLYKEVLQNQLKTFIENDNAVYPQYKGIDLQEFSSKNPTKADDIIAMRKEIFETTAQAFKIPLSMMYGNITNMNEIVKVYLSICIDPLADMIGEEMTRKYYGYEEWKDGYYIKVDTSCVNHVDILEVANEVYNLVGAGFSLDELRDRLDKQLLNTEFSRKHFLSKNFVPAEDMLNPDTVKGGE